MSEPARTSDDALPAINLSAARRVCVVTGSRAEYGLTRWLMRELSTTPDIVLQVLVTGTHLDPTYGTTISEIENDGLSIAERVPIDMGTGAPIDTVNAVGLGTRDIGAALIRLKPDIVVVFGDRFEMLSAAQAAMFLNLPVAHIGGGDTAQGTHDNYVRHAITKMAQLHFTTHEDAHRRVVQLGEDPMTVFNTGALANDAVLGTPMLDAATTTALTGIRFDSPVVLVAHHPISVDRTATAREISALLEFIRDILDEGLEVVITGTNADAGNDVIRSAYEPLLGEHRRSVHFVENLGGDLYINVLRHSTMLVGNSSSGLYEAPLVGTPTLDVGTRQLGRAAGTSVLRVSANASAMRSTADHVLAGHVTFENYPYGRGPAAPRIAAILRATNLDDLHDKSFHDIAFGRGTGL